MNVIRALNLALSFLIELAMLAALSYWGFVVGDSLLSSLSLAVLIPLSIAVFWGVFMAPRAVRPVTDPLHTIIALLLFGLAAAGLYATGLRSLCWTYAVLVVLNRLLVHSFKWSDKRSDV